MRDNETPAVISLKSISKIFKLYEKSSDRLKESLSLTSKKYHNPFYALYDITFDVFKGETIGILGKNGSGKSTLLKIITGVLTQTSGSVNVNGRVSALLELGAGFNLEFTGLENIYLNGTILGYSREEMNKKLNAILEFAEIGDFVYQPVKLYSSGMFARLAFALAINVEPDILIVDEALAVGDIRFQSKCFDRFKELKKLGTTILFVSHDVQSVRNFCDKAIWLDQGKVRMLGNTVDVTASYIQYMNSFAEPHSENSSIKELSEPRKQNESKMRVGKFNFINRWGKFVGLIKYVDLLNSKGNPTELLHYGENVSVKVGFYVDENIVDLNTLSIAISIKNKQGIDIIVSTTFDNEIIRITKRNKFYETEFLFTNYLTSDDYILVAAIEDRSQSLPQYYDFIEGAKYFRVLTDRQLFGIISLPMKKNIIEIKGEEGKYE
ncbi:ABC transporter ATP-binding protein [Paenibacillus sp. YN15]|uniref:ABC transporter ATP-binding protein n=1 Tax=Paenibacillus sp. YN15 TaxID=1742774 RepID=UPI000DCE6B9A|nr:ABC transporter ATP-binding protein [Paenibacillus sp. YN15]RAU93229.1 ABC transporter ATP-binding protein [Paenibacillus sp. YN15]